MRCSRLRGALDDPPCTAEPVHALYSHLASCLKVDALFFFFKVPAEQLGTSKVTQTIHSRTLSLLGRGSYPLPLRVKTLSDGGLGT